MDYYNKDVVYGLFSTYFIVNCATFNDKLNKAVPAIPVDKDRNYSQLVSDKMSIEITN